MGTKSMNSLKILVSVTIAISIKSCSIASAANPVKGLKYKPVVGE